MIAIAVFGILAGMAVPRLPGFTSITVERLYSTFIVENNNEDSRINQFLAENFDELCPVGAVISYLDGEVIRITVCSIRVVKKQVRNARFRLDKPLGSKCLYIV